jgi:excisionase family DNA binding protein
MENRKPLSTSSKEHLTTGEAAALCSVTPDTVLKWIRAGKIPAYRTAGGHHRIPRSALLNLLDGDLATPQVNYGVGSFQYCWEFNSETGQLPDGCEECIVYRTKTHRCYEVANLPSSAGYSGVYCKSTCDECEYFEMVRDQLPNVLVITDQKRLKDSLDKEKDDIGFNLRITDCEYRCSTLVEKFRPDYVVLDCSMGSERSHDFVSFLYEDKRIPFVRIVLVGDRKDISSECDKKVFALIERRFTARTLSDLISGRHSPLPGGS